MQVTQYLLKFDPLYCVSIFLSRKNTVMKRAYAGLAEKTQEPQNFC